MSLRYEITLKEDWDSIGIALMPSASSSRLIVAEIDPNGDAFNFKSDRGGIQVGDLLWSINGEKIQPEDTTTDDQLGLLRNLSFPITLSFKRSISETERNALSQSGRKLSWMSSKSSILSQSTSNTSILEEDGTAQNVSLDASGKDACMDEKLQSSNWKFSPDLTSSGHQRAKSVMRWLEIDDSDTESVRTENSTSPKKFKENVRKPSNLKRCVNPRDAYSTSKEKNSSDLEIANKPSASKQQLLGNIEAVIPSNFSITSYSEKFTKLPRKEPVRVVPRSKSIPNSVSEPLFGADSAVRKCESDRISRKISDHKPFTEADKSSNKVDKTRNARVYRASVTSEYSNLGPDRVQIRAESVPLGMGKPRIGGVNVREMVIRKEC